MKTLRPIGMRTFLLRPFLPEGETDGGVYVPGHHRGINTIYGRVIATSDTCRQVRAKDWVVFPPQRPIRVPWSGGVVYVLDEPQTLGIVMPADERPWFEDNKQTERTVHA